jgi:selenide, water dikinase
MMVVNWADDEGGIFHRSGQFARSATTNAHGECFAMSSPAGIAGSSIRLTDLAHGGGCGCKLAPSVLQQLLADQPAAAPYAQLLVGTETGDDAAVWQIDDKTCVIATTDFFMPVVDDPRDFGRIAAANALSDVYAMGGRPIMALAILGMPLGKLPLDAVRLILEGGASICAEAGIPVAGGHSIDAVEPIYGLAVIGLCRPDHVRRNSGARPGDALILTKGIGVGIYSAAFKKLALPDDAYAEMIASTTLLNRVGHVLSQDDHVHGITDVTGFGLLGHGLELARGGRVQVIIEQNRIPLLAQAERLAQAGYITGASGRNWDSYGDQVILPPDLAPWRRALLTDPQTSGGLLVACRAERAESLRAMIEAAGYPRASIVGTVMDGEPAVRIV